jgi:hypothetical protein
VIIPIPDDVLNERAVDKVGRGKIPISVISEGASQAVGSLRLLLVFLKKQ